MHVNEVGLLGTQWVAVVEVFDTHLGFDSEDGNYDDAPIGEIVVATNQAVAKQAFAASWKANTGRDYEWAPR